MKPKHLLVLFAGLVATGTVAQGVANRMMDGPPPQTSVAVITPAPTPTIVYAPIQTTSTTTSLAEAPKTAHDAMQADLGTLLTPNTPCQEWAPLVLEVGWPEDELVNVLEEMWNESRCQNIIPGNPHWNGHDHGLMQINQVWKEETANLFGSWEAIDDPTVNLAMALEIWRWHETNHGCGWEPWSRPCE